jgi:two-component system LytT family response regulator
MYLSNRSTCIALCPVPTVDLLLSVKLLDNTFIFQGYPGGFVTSIHRKIMLLKCIAIDKEHSALELISSYIDAFPALKLLQTFDDILAASEFLRRNEVNLLIIEAGLPDLSAIDLIKSLGEKLLIIFTVGIAQLPAAILDLDVIDYLIKPFGFERFAKAAEKAIEQFNPASLSPGTIYIRSTYQLVKINLDEIEYIESAENYIKIHLLNSKSIMALMPLKAILEKLPADKFVRIHRGYIISVNKIQYFLNRKVKLREAELPVGESYLLKLKEIIHKS